MLDSKLKTDLYWSYSSMAIMAASGFLINILIGRYTSPTILGVFNQVYAIYVISSQVSVLGIHHSALRHGAKHTDSKTTLSEIFKSAILLSALLGLFFSILLYWLSFHLQAFYSPAVCLGISYAAFGLFFFSINKTIIGFLNGLRDMRCIAFGQILRTLLMIFFISWVIALEKPTVLICGCFAFSEIILLIFLILFTRRFFTLAKVEFIWIAKHFAFGIRSFFSGILLEINTRVDILIIGLFLNDSAVGIYSIVSMIAEGFFNLLIVLRNTLNPILVKHIADGKIQDIKDSYKKLRRILLPTSIMISLIIYLLFQPLITLAIGNNAFLESQKFLPILLFGLCYYASYAPFDWILLQAGHPTQHSLLTLVNVLINIALVISFIQIWGLYGVSIGTALAMVLASISLNLFMKKILGFTLGI